jgi:carbonic anhydrase
MKQKTVLLFIPGLTLAMTFNACTKNNSSTEMNSSVAPESAETHRHVLNGYPANLVSSPLIDSELPQSVIDAQTPIDIRTNNTIKFFSSTPDVHYGTITLNNVLNNEGENLKISLSSADMAKNYVIISGKKYTLNQFHFHYGSEHTINGDHKAMEIHFVNIAADNSYAVLGVLVQFGNYNKALQTLFNASPHVSDGVSSSSARFNLDQLFPENTSLYYTYSGSLTTPNYGVNSSIPNGGPVTWIVYKNADRLSQGQLHFYQEIYEEPNVRSTQPLNGRIVYEHLPK